VIGGSLPRERKVSRYAVVRATATTANRVTPAVSQVRKAFGGCQVSGLKKQPHACRSCDRSTNVNRVGRWGNKSGTTWKRPDELSVVPRVNMPGCRDRWRGPCFPAVLCYVAGGENVDGGTPERSRSLTDLPIRTGVIYSGWSGGADGLGTMRPNRRPQVRQPSRPASSLSRIQAIP
jgi:hypothetical protein